MNAPTRRGDAASIVAIVSGAHFLSHVFLLAFPPLFPILGRAFGLSTTRLGLLVTAIYVPTLLVQLPVGEVVDRMGARRVLVAGTVVTALGITLAGVAPNYPVLLACAFLSGIGQSAFHPADYALLGAVTDPSTEGTAFSVHTFGGYAGFAVAPVVVGGIAIAADWRIALIAVGAVGFLYAAVVQSTAEPVHTRTVRSEPTGSGSTGPEAVESAAAGADAAGSDATGTEAAGADSAGSASLRDAVRDAAGELAAFARRFEMRLVFAFYLTSMMAVVGLQSFTTVLAVDGFGFAESTANTLLTAHLSATAVGVLAGGPLADRLPFRGVLAAMLLSAAVGVWALAASSAPEPVVAGGVLAVVGFLVGLALPSRDKFANAVADPGAAGRSFGFYFTGLSLGAVVSPALLGAVIDRSSPAAAFVLVGGFLVAAVAIVAVARVTGVGRIDGDPARIDG